MEANEILDTSVAVERKKGTVTVFTLIEYPNASKKDFDVIIPDMDDYTKSIEIANTLRELGTPVGAIDILIASMCLNKGKSLLAKDKDFIRISKAVPELDVALV
ncbi:hypothetical protein CMO91_04760 [Candidatus Woesearchaeota archaeon]|nr:hypothetical protein [Candidatus Woesearchaeota archaeon]|tara:strand:- start:127 stop:438 length:312 start_codon:yes stop_codon:yes gene_type:complete